MVGWIEERRLQQANCNGKGKGKAKVTTEADPPLSAKDDNQKANATANAGVLPHSTSLRARMTPVWARA
jgi:hypothetical protein